MISVTDHVEAPKPALQQRSRKTVDAIARAALRLLRTSSYEEITVERIVAEAKSSTGSFYARFPSKEDLLFHLAERILLEFVVPEASKRLDPEANAHCSVEERMLKALGFVSDVFLVHRAVLRPLTLQMHVSTDPRVKGSATRFNAVVHGAFLRLMKASPELQRVNDLDTALSDIVTWIGAALRQLLLLRDPPGARERRRAIAELGNCMALYLRSKK